MGMMINRRRVCGGKSLPYDYEVEYLENDGYSCIDTAQYFIYDDHVIVKGYIPQKPGRLIKGGTEKRTCIEFGQFSDAWQGGVYYGSGEYVVRTFLRDKIAVFEYRSNDFFIDGVRKVHMTIKTFITDYTVYLFSPNKYDGVEYPYTEGYRIYSYKHKRNNTFLIDLIPVVDKQGVGCMYDKVSKQLFYNQGTGSFIVGPRVS